MASGVEESGYSLDLCSSPDLGFASAIKNGVPLALPALDEEFPERFVEGTVAASELLR